MTGGVLYLRAAQLERVNSEFLAAHELDDAAEAELRTLLEDYRAATGSATAAALLADAGALRTRFRRLLPGRR